MWEPCYLLFVTRMEHETWLEMAGYIRVLIDPNWHYMSYVHVDKQTNKLDDCTRSNSRLIGHSSCQFLPGGGHSWWKRGGGPKCKNFDFCPQIWVKLIVFILRFLDFLPKDKRLSAMFEIINFETSQDRIMIFWTGQSFLLFVSV